MNVKHWYDKSTWNDGPWKVEPDYVAWVEYDTMYRCVARRNIYGAWSGVVGVDENHPLFMIESGGEEYNYIDVHGGILYTGFSVDDDRVFAPPKKLWWVGFDCMGEYDLCPVIKDEPQVVRRKKKTHASAKYRTLEYVQDQIGILAEQVAFFDNRL